MKSDCYDRYIGCSPNYEHGNLYSKRLKEFFDIEKLSIFTETGTYHGNGVLWALRQQNFKKIYSTEILTSNYNKVINTFKDSKTPVNLYNLDTLVFLNDNLQLFQEPTLFFLDAHGGNGNEFGTNAWYSVPLVHELSLIYDKFYNLKNLLIVIDDVRLFDSEKPNDWEPSIFFQIIKESKNRGLISLYLDDSLILCDPCWVL